MSTENENMIYEVKWFNSIKQFGFLEREGAEDLFIHASELMLDEDSEGNKFLKTGVKVLVGQIFEGEKGLFAKDVSLVEEEESDSNA